MKLPDDVKDGFSPSQIGHVASEVDHDVRNEDWDDEKKGWDKIRWNNRAMGMALVTIRKLEENIESLNKYIKSTDNHLPDCWKLGKKKGLPCTCGLDTYNMKDDPS